MKQSLYNTIEAAEYLGINPPMVRWYLRKNRLKFIKKVNEQYIMTKSELDRFRSTLKK
jgi:predicted site-specific integrase-resolvase